MANAELRNEWTEIQNQLRQKLIQTDSTDWCLNSTEPNTSLKWVGGLDISFLEEGNLAVACLVVLHFPDMQVVYEDYEHVQLTMPYISGFLAFREARPFMTLINRVKTTNFNPEVIIIDGNGILHQRRFGSASHLGVISGYPTVGVAKSLCCIDGLVERQVKQEVEVRMAQQNSLANTSGEVSELRGRSGDLHGMALFCHGRNHTKNPIYISIGHRVSLETAVELVKRCAMHRIPEPIRQADLRSRAYIRRLTQAI